jgi:hypothetical protein
MGKFSETQQSSITIYPFIACKPRKINFHFPFPFSANKQKLAASRFLFAANKRKWLFSYSCFLFAEFREHGDGDTYTWKHEDMET